MKWIQYSIYRYNKVCLLDHWCRPKLKILDSMVFNTALDLESTRISLCIFILWKTGKYGMTLTETRLFRLADEENEIKKDTLFKEYQSMRQINQDHWYLLWELHRHHPCHLERLKCWQVHVKEKILPGKSGKPPPIGPPAPPNLLASFSITLRTLGLLWWAANFEGSVLTSCNKSDLLYIDLEVFQSMLVENYR